MLISMEYSLIGTVVRLITLMIVNWILFFGERKPSKKEVLSVVGAFWGVITFVCNTLII